MLINRARSSFLRAIYGFHFHTSTSIQSVATELLPTAIHATTYLTYLQHATTAPAPAPAAPAPAPAPAAAPAAIGTAGKSWNLAPQFLVALLVAWALLVSA
jgi:hypothetical protein